MMALLKMSGSAATLITAIIVIRAATINKLPKKTFIILWGVALCRLLVPFTFSSPLSFYTMISNLYVSAVDTPTAIYPATMNLQRIMGVPLSAEYATMPAAPSIDPAFLLTPVWLSGAIACSLFFTVVHLRWADQSA